MKNKFLYLILTFIFVMPFSLFLSACSNQTFTYLSYMPTIYEADLVCANEYDTENFSVIKRYERIEGNEYLVIYDKYTSQSYSGLNQEWLRIWNASTEFWDDYKWNETASKWESGTIDSIFARVDNLATYTNGVELKSSNLVVENERYLEYKWGNSKTPDILRISNNDYHIMLYHKFYRSDDTNNYNEFTKFTFDESTSAIPHLASFTFENS